MLRRGTRVCTHLFIRSTVAIYLMNLATIAHAQQSFTFSNAQYGTHGSSERLIDGDDILTVTATGSISAMNFPAVHATGANNRISVLGTLITLNEENIKIYGDDNTLDIKGLSMSFYLRMKNRQGIDVLGDRNIVDITGFVFVLGPLKLTGLGSAGTPENPNVGTRVTLRNTRVGPLPAHPGENNAAFLSRRDAGFMGIFVQAYRGGAHAISGVELGPDSVLRMDENTQIEVTVSNLGRSGPVMGVVFESLPPGWQGPVSRLIGGGKILVRPDSERTQSIGILDRQGAEIEIAETGSVSVFAHRIDDLAAVQDGSAIAVSLSQTVSSGYFRNRGILKTYATTRGPSLVFQGMATMDGYSISNTGVMEASGRHSGSATGIHIGGDMINTIVSFGPVSRLIAEVGVDGDTLLPRTTGTATGARIHGRGTSVDIESGARVKARSAATQFPSLNDPRAVGLYFDGADMSLDNRGHISAFSQRTAVSVMWSRLGGVLDNSGTLIAEAEMDAVRTRVAGIYISESGDRADPGASMVLRHSGLLLVEARAGSGWGITTPDVIDDHGSYAMLNMDISGRIVVNGSGSGDLFGIRSRLFGTTLVLTDSGRITVSSGGGAGDMTGIELFGGHFTMAETSLVSVSATSKEAQGSLYGIVLNQGAEILQNPRTHRIAGSVEVKSENGGRDTLGILSRAPAEVVEISGDVSVDSSGTAGFTGGIWVDSAGVSGSVRHSGHMSVRKFQGTSPGDAFAIKVSSGTGPSVENKGEIRVETVGGHIAQGISIGDPQAPDADLGPVNLHNVGRISVSAETGTARGIGIQGALGKIDVRNSGSMEVRASSEYGTVQGIHVSRAPNGGTIHNSGDIFLSGTPGPDSRVARVAGSGFRFTNTGRILTNVDGIRFEGNGNILENSGTIEFTETTGIGGMALISSDGYLNLVNSGSLIGVLEGEYRVPVIRLQGGGRLEFQKGTVLRGEIVLEGGETEVIIDMEDVTEPVQWKFSGAAAGNIRGGSPRVKTSLSTFYDPAAGTLFVLNETPYQRSVDVLTQIVADVSGFVGSRTLPSSGVSDRKRVNLWSSVFHSRRSFARSGLRLETKIQHDGSALGVDIADSDPDSWQVGVFAGYDEGYMDIGRTDNPRSSSRFYQDLSGLFAGMYGTREFGNISVRGAILAGIVDHDDKRRTSDTLIAGDERFVLSSYASSWVSPEVSVMWDVQCGKGLTCMPSLKVAYVREDVGSYAEGQDASGGLKYDGRSTSMISGRAQFALSKTLKDQNLVRGHAGLEYTHVLRNELRLLLGKSTKTHSPAKEVDRLSMLFGLGMDLNLSSEVSFSVDMDALFSDSDLDMRIAVNLNMQF